MWSSSLSADKLNVTTLGKATQIVPESTSSVVFARGYPIRKENHSYFRVKT